MSVRAILTGLVLVIVQTAITPYPILRCQNPLALAGGCRHRLLYCAKKTLDFWSKILYDITIYGLGYATFSLTLIDPNHPFAGVA